MVESWFGWWRWRTNSWGCWYSRRCHSGILKLDDQKESERILYSLGINHWFPPIISNICLLESFQMIHSGFPKKRSNFWHMFPDSKNWGKYGSKNPFEKKVTTPFLWDGLLMLLFIRCTYNKKEAVHNFIGLIYVPSSSLCFTTAQAVAWKFSSLSF